MISLPKGACARKWMSLFSAKKSQCFLQIPRRLGKPAWWVHHPGIGILHMKFDFVQLMSHHSYTSGFPKRKQCWFQWSYLHTSSSLAPCKSVGIHDFQIYHVCALFHLKPSAHGAKPLFKRSKNNHLLYISVLLLMRSSDCESNPGPRTPTYPCQVCSKACRWGQRAIACDSCGPWCRTNCLGMQTPVFNY